MAPTTSFGLHVHLALSTTSPGEGKLPILWLCVYFVADIENVLPVFAGEIFVSCLGCRAISASAKEAESTYQRQSERD
jgi:hypothetical protein